MLFLNTYQTIFLYLGHRATCGSVNNGRHINTWLTHQGMRMKILRIFSLECFIYGFAMANNFLYSIRVMYLSISGFIRTLLRMNAWERSVNLRMKLWCLQIFQKVNLYFWQISALASKGPILYLIFCHCHNHSHSNKAYQQCLPSSSVQSYRINIAKALWLWLWLWQEK